MKSKPPIITLPVFCLFILIGCASQKDVIILDERLMILERQNQELHQKVDSLQNLVQAEVERVGKTTQSAETDLRTRYAGVNADMAAMQQELRLLSGRIDEIMHMLNQKITSYETDAKTRQAKLDELSLRTAQLTKRSAEIEKYLNLETSGGNDTPGDNGASPARKNGDNADDLYDAAKKIYDGGQLEQARRQFEEFLKTYPDSRNADNAQFWIGETYYREKWYEKAILEYQSVIEKYPKGNKVAAAMLKQGMAFLELGDTSNAALIWKELQKKYPGTNEAKIAAAKLKNL